jgi:hypothetical protein
MISYSSDEGGSGSRIDAIRGAIVVSLLNRLDAFAASARTSISAVADAGVGVSYRTNRGEAVEARALHLEVLQKKEGDKPALKISPTRNAEHVLEHGGKGWGYIRVVQDPAEGGVNVVFVQE